MDAPVYQWLKETLREEHFMGQTVLEVGSQDYNGTVRPIVEAFKPESYVGVDFQAGKGVDSVVNVHDLVKTFGESSFDVVISTEMLEHVEDWRSAIDQMKTVLKPGGLLILTTRRPGFEQHGYPHDHWRFTPDNLRAAMTDFWVKQCQPVSGQGVVLMASKTLNWEQPDSLAHIHPARCPAKPYTGFRRLLWIKVAYRLRNPAAPVFRPSDR